MLFGGKEDSCNIQLNGIKLEQVNSFKLVGVNINKDLTWDEHATAVISKMKKAIYPLYKLKYTLNETNKLMVYNTLIISHLTYCLPI